MSHYLDMCKGCNHSTCPLDINLSGRWFCVRCTRVETAPVTFWERLRRLLLKVRMSL